MLNFSAAATFFLSDGLADGLTSEAFFVIVRYVPSAPGHFPTQDSSLLAGLPEGDADGEALGLADGLGDGVTGAFLTLGWHAPKKAAAATRPIQNPKSKIENLCCLLIVFPQNMAASRFFLSRLATPPAPQTQFHGLIPRAKISWSKDQ
jgi:hypothetical protein